MDSEVNQISVVAKGKLWHILLNTKDMGGHKLHGDAVRQAMEYARVRSYTGPIADSMCCTHEFGDDKKCLKCGWTPSEHLNNLCQRN
jgi:hypothetical protein